MLFNPWVFSASQSSSPEFYPLMALSLGLVRRPVLAGGTWGTWREQRASVCLCGLVCAPVIWDEKIHIGWGASGADEAQPGAWSLAQETPAGAQFVLRCTSKKKKKMPVHVSHWLWWLLTRISVVIASSYWEAFPFHPQLFGWGLAPPSGASTAPVWSVDVPVLEMPICHPSHSLSAQLLLLQVQGSFLPCSPH